jgi:hypothetical protein
MNFRMLPPVAISAQTMTINGRQYSGTPGTVLDIPDFDAAVLGANGWAPIAPSGPTALRPSPLAGKTPPYLAAPGFEYFDTTLGKLIFFDGATWRDPATGSAV